MSISRQLAAALAIATVLGGIVRTADGENLTRSAFTDWYPVWSPDSQRLLFQSNRGKPPQVYEALITHLTQANE